MSALTQLIAAISDSERQLDSQIGLLNNYLTEIDNVTKRIEDALSGGGSSYQQMAEKMAATKSQVEDTMQKLEMAKQKLEQIRVV